MAQLFDTVLKTWVSKEMKTQLENDAEVKQVKTSQVVRTAIAEYLAKNPVRKAKHGGKSTSSGR